MNESPKNGKKSPRKPPKQTASVAGSKSSNTPPESSGCVFVAVAQCDFPIKWMCCATSYKAILTACVGLSTTRTHSRRTRSQNAPPRLMAKTRLYYPRKRGRLKESVQSGDVKPHTFTQLCRRALKCVLARLASVSAVSFISFWHRRNTAINTRRRTISRMKHFHRVTASNISVQTLDFPRLRRTNPRRCTLI